uniref:C2H2-type domain-containing protein n=1 Tax=Timema cristinae TaxID=61476 RepID=A0A7R9D4V7_TIMCR|nr:unnamed protein product [Timema cristinae]
MANSPLAAIGDRSAHPGLRASSRIVAVKKVFLKAPSRIFSFKAALPNTPLPPQPVLTCWDTWLHAVLYYVDHLGDIQKVVQTFDKEQAAAITKANAAISCSSVIADLAYVKSNFGAVTVLEARDFPLVKAVKIMRGIEENLTQSGSVGTAIVDKVNRVLQRNPGAKMDLTTHKFKDTLQQFNNLDKSIPYTKSAETIRLEQELHEAIFARIKEENVEELTCEVSPAVDASNWQSSGALRENEYTLPTSEKPDDSAAVTSMLPSELLSPHFLALNFGPQPTPTTLGELCGRIETGKWGLTSVISHYMMFPCSFCDNVYTRPEYLGRHNCRRSKMSKAKSRRKRPVEFIFNESEPSNSVIRPDRFSCSVCGKMFVRRYHLTAHEKYHSNVKPFECTMCDSKFHRKTDLTVHSRIHSGEKPFECERPYCCNVCSLKFRAKSDLKRHSFTHVADKPFNCGDCGAKFNQLAHLRNHTRRHTGEKPFSCPLCGKKFGRSSTLAKHKASHKEIRYNCLECPEKFKTSVDLIKHIRSAHK